MPRAAKAKAKTRPQPAAAKKGRQPKVPPPTSADGQTAALDRYFARMEQNLAERMDNLVESHVARAMTGLEERLQSQRGPDSQSPAPPAQNDGLTLGQVVSGSAATQASSQSQQQSAGSNTPTPASASTAVHVPAGQQINPNTPGIDAMPAIITSQASYPFPLDARVTPKLKAKIVANEFVDFGPLINPSKADVSKLEFEEGDDGAVSLVRKAGPQMFTQSLRSITEWDTAFTIYCTVYCSAYPSAMSGLLKFGDRVKRIARRGGDWQYYDVGFRTLRHYDPTLPWSYYHGELHGEAMNERPRSGQPFRGQGPPRQRYRVPRGFCTKFHTGGTYSGGCSWKHECPKCGDVHPGYKCQAASKPRPKTGKPVQQQRNNAATTTPAPANTSAAQATSGPSGRVRP